MTVSVGVTVSERVTESTEKPKLPDHIERTEKPYVPVDGEGSGKDKVG